MGHTGPVSNSSNPEAWGQGGPAPAPAGSAAPASANGPTAPRKAPKKKSGLWWKILVGIIAIIVILLVIAEFGVRAYAKNTVVDEMRSSLEEDGTKLEEDPDVSFGSTPLLWGLAQGKIPSFEATVPSTFEVNYEDNDESRPVVSGQPEMTMNAKDMELNEDDPIVDDLTVDTTLPPEFLLAEIQKSQSEGGEGAAGSGDAENAQDDSTAEDNPLSGALEDMISVTGVEPNTEENTLDFAISGGLATLSMTPELKDDGLTFSVADVQILGMSLPEELTQDLTDSLESSVNQTEGLQIKDAKVTSDGLQVQLHGTDVNLNEIDTSGTFSTESGGGSGDSGSDSAGGSGAEAGSTDMALDAAA